MRLRSDGKRDIKFDADLARRFYEGKPCFATDAMSLPCGRCLGCRLERSRQWAIRCVHEAKFSRNGNCFLTLTYSPEFLPKNMSLDKRQVSLFNKRLRRFAIPKDIRDKRGCSHLRKLWVSENPIRFFYCGEYGDRYGRPHYHSIVFNFDFGDKVYWKTVNGCKYYTSESLSKLWPYGFSTIGAVTFESAAYVARYALKKVTGDKADEHYSRVNLETGEVYQIEREFAIPSRNPGIGFDWFHKYAETDLIPQDSVVSRGVECKVPRYYDTLWERYYPKSFLEAKEARRLRAEEKEDNSSFKRLQTRLKCQEARVRLLIRNMEV